MLNGAIGLVLSLLQYYKSTHFKLHIVSSVKEKHYLNVSTKAASNVCAYDYGKGPLYSLLFSCGIGYMWIMKPFMPSDLSLFSILIPLGKSEFIPRVLMVAKTTLS